MKIPSSKRLCFRANPARLVSATLLFALVGGAGLRGWCADTTETNQLVQQFKKLSLEELLDVKISTVYGASKHEQRIAEAPSDVTIVTADEIKKSGYRTLAEILNSVRGFYTTSDRAYDYIGTRGFNRLGDYGGRILITIDGHRLNDAVYDHADIGAALPLDVDLIERVEIIRGSGSSLYGNNALFAVINLITRRGSDFNGGEVSGAYGSYDTYTGRFSYGNHFTNGLDVVVSGSYLDSAGDNRRYGGSLAPGNAGQNEAPSAPSAFVSISYQDISFEGGYVKRQKNVLDGDYGTVFNNPNSTIMDERAFADLKLQHHFQNDWELAARIYGDYYRYEGNYPNPEHPFGDPLYPGQITYNHDQDNQDSLGGELQLSRTFFENHRVTAGAEYRHDFSVGQRNYDIGGPTYLTSDITADTVGAYVQDEYAIFHNLILNAGLRYDYFSSFGDTVNPRAALIYSPCTNSTFKAIYGEAFRAPNAYEFYYIAPGYSANQQLKPETIRSYELDYDQGITPHLKLVSSVFYHQVDDLISFGSDSAGNSTFGNLASATSQGGEIELDAHWARGWRTRLSYTYTDTRDSTTGQRPSNSPEHLAKFNLTAPLWQEKIFANLEILGMSDRTTVLGDTIGGYWVANFTLFSRELVKGLELSAGVYNLFDKKYSDPVSGDFALDRVPQDGRTFRVKLTYHF